MDKTQLRKDLLAQRDAFSDSEKVEVATAISNHLSVFELFSKSKVVMFYVSTGSEVSTKDMIQSCLGQKQVVIPKVEHDEIIPSLMMSMENLMPGYQNILEPITALPIRFQNIDLVFVPGVAFDKRGYRIGYGKGMYDQFLKKVPNAVKVGLTYSKNIVEEIPKDEWDVKMDYVVSEEGINTLR